ncbi:MAG: hypothetical protein HRT77_09115 [Halioglobus sp.]|nr:hypothetical protein [Halioglobus sp.]
MDKIKVIQWYTGEIARHQIRVLARSPDMELVGAFVFHEEKVGIDAGELAGIDTLGITTTSNMEEILAIDADVVLYNPPLERYDDIIPILTSGKNVISIMAGWNPTAHKCYPDIVEACKKGNVSLFGTGLNPGLSYELAIMASSCCTDVESVYIKTCEQQASLSEVFLQHFGFGKSQEELRSNADTTYAIFHNLMDITDLISDKIGLPRDGRKFDVDFEPATKDYEEKITVKQGSMAGLLITASSTHAGIPVATIEVRFLLGDEYVSEAFLAGRPKAGWIEVDVRGTPGSRIYHEVYMEEDIIGTWSTGTRAIYAIPGVVAAPAGLLSPLDLPIPHKLPLRAEK